MAFFIQGSFHRYRPPAAPLAENSRYQITNTDIGLGLVWANAEFCWTSVPKNANMVFRKFLQQIGINAVQYHSELGQQHSICVIRDPHIRLISGMGEYCRRKRLSNTGPDLQKLFEQFLEDPTVFDEHLEPQVAFLQGKCYTAFLKFENLYEHTISHPYLAPHERTISRYMNPDRLTNSRHYTGQSLQDIYDFHQEICDQLVERYYARDLEIWRQPDDWIGKVI